MDSGRRGGILQPVNFLTVLAKNSMESIRVFLVDDNPEFLEAATHFLATDPGIEIIGSANSGRSALEQVTRLEPDLVLIDLEMPEMNGLEVTRQIKAQPHPPCVVILTLHDNPVYDDLAKSVHADSLITKSGFGAEVLRLIYTLHTPRGDT